MRQALLRQLHAGREAKVVLGVVQEVVGGPPPEDLAAALLELVQGQGRPLGLFLGDGGGERKNIPSAGDEDIGKGIGARVCEHGVHLLMGFGVGDWGNVSGGGVVGWGWGMCSLMCGM